MLFLALVPLLTVSMIVGYYLTSIRLEDARQSLMRHGSTITKDLARSSEFSMAIGDIQQLENLVSASLSYPEIQSVTIYDANQKILVSQQKTIQQKRPGKYPQPIQFIETVTPAQPGNAELQEFSGDHASTTALGKVVVTISLAVLDKRQREIIFKGSIIVLAGALFSALLGILMARGVITPIQHIIKGVEHIGQGNLSTRVQQTSTGNLGQLEAGINAMADTIQTSQQDLQSRIHQATAELAQSVNILKHQNTELEQARQAALQASDAKATFLAQISHELRTPLNAIIGFTHLLETEIEEAGQQEYLQVINQSSQQLLTVINDVLNISSLESGQLQIDKKIFNPAILLEDVVIMLSHEAHKKGLEIALLIHQDAPDFIEGDPIRFTQILTNLINNAIKFTHNGEVVITADASRSKDGTQNLHVTIRDSGVGIKNMDIKSLFQPFIQGDNSVTKQFGGTGLGLAIAKRMTEQMGGEISACQNPQQGSSFWFTLPANQQTTTAITADLCLTGKRVILVESNPFTRRAIRNLLLSFNMAVFIKPDIQSVLTTRPHERTDQTTDEIILLGLNKPEATRPALIQSVSDLQKTGANIIVLIGDEATARKWSNHFPPGHLQVTTKPIRRKKLFRLLNTSEPVVTAAHGSAPRKKHPTPTKIIKTLIAEDNHYNRQLLKTYLQKNGCEVDETHDGLDAVAQAGKQPYDFIFLDLHMPGLDGVSACKAIQSHKSLNRTTPIIAVTADIYFEASDTGFSDTIYKPLTEHALQKILGKKIQIPQPAEVTDHEPSTAHPPGLIPEITAQFNALKQAHQALDQAELKNRIHQINGLTRFFSINELPPIGLALEQAIDKGTKADIDCLIVQLDQKIQKIYR